MHSLAESRLVHRQSSVIAYIIADYFTQSVDKKVIRDRRVIRPCMKELYYFRLTRKILQLPSLSQVKRGRRDSKISTRGNCDNIDKENDIQAKKNTKGGSQDSQVRHHCSP